MPNELEAHLWTGDRGLPTLYLDDVSAIPFLVNIAGVEAYQHRARTRAGDGDLFATVTPPTEDYEEYCRKILGLGRPGLVLVSGGCKLHICGGRKLHTRHPLGWAGDLSGES